MEGATFTAATAAADNIGIIAVLLLIFVFFFIWKCRDDAKKQDAERQEYQENMERLSERENMLIAQSEKREEMLKADADRREKLLCEESAKRESILMVNMERIADSMDNITKTLGKMEGRLDRIEQKMERGERNAGK